MFWMAGEKHKKQESCEVWRERGENSSTEKQITKKSDWSLSYRVCVVIYFLWSCWTRNKYRFASFLLYWLSLEALLILLFGVLAKWNSPKFKPKGTLNTDLLLLTKTKRNLMTTKSLNEYGSNWLCVWSVSRVQSGKTMNKKQNTYFDIGRFLKGSVGCVIR